MCIPQGISYIAPGLVQEKSTACAYRNVLPSFTSDIVCITLLYFPASHSYPTLNLQWKNLAMLLVQRYKNNTICLYFYLLLFFQCTTFVYYTVQPSDKKYISVVTGERSKDTNFRFCFATFFRIMKKEIGNRSNHTHTCRHTLAHTLNNTFWIPLPL